MCSKPIKCKFDHYWGKYVIWILSIQYTKNTRYFAVYSWKMFLTDMASWLIHGKHLPAQVKYHPNMPLDPEAGTGGVL